MFTEDQLLPTPRGPAKKSMLLKHDQIRPKKFEDVLENELEFLDP